MILIELIVEMYFSMILIFTCLALHSKSLPCLITEEKANCVRRHLTTVPKLPNTITVLDLSCNEIVELPNNSFQYFINLTELLLCHNEIKTLSSLTFYGLGKLKNLFYF